MGQNFLTLKDPNALADMFGLPQLPIPQSSPARSPSPVAAISISQLCYSPSAPSIPTTRPHSPEPESGPSKWPITWDLKDPRYPLHQWDMQQAYKEHIEQAEYDYPVPRSPSVKSGSQPASPASPQEASPQQSTSPHSETTDLHSPGLESIPEEEEAAPPGGHHQLPTMLGGIHQDPWSHQLSCYCYLWLTILYLVISDSLKLLLLSLTHCSILSYLLSLSYL